MARLSVGVSADANEASATFKELAADIKKVGTESVGVTDGVARVDTALAKLAKAADNPRALAMAMAKASVEVEDLRDALVKAGPSGSKAMGQIAEALKKADQAIENTAKRAGRLKDAMESSGRSVGDAKDKIDSFSMALSSPDAAFNRMRDSTHKFDQAIGKLGGSLIVAKQGFDLAEKAGQALAKAIDEWDAKRAVADKRQADASVNTIKHAHALELAKRGFIGLGGSTEQFLAKYDAYIAKTSPATRATEAQTKALEAQKRAMEDLGRAMDSAGKTVEFKLVSPEQAFGDAGKYANALNELLKKAFETGGTEARDEWAKANESTIERVIAAYAKWGKEVPSHVKAAYDAMKKESVDWIAVLERENAAADAAYQQKLDRWAAEDAAANRTSRAPEQYKQIQDAAFGAAVAAGELGTNLDNVAAAVVATGGTMVVGAPYLIQYAQASREVTQALLDQAVATKGLREEQAQALDATKGWTDYLITLKEGYESGITTLYNYKVALADFKTQILQLFAGATGEAKKSVDALLDLIRELERTTTGGHQRTSGPVGWLNDAIKRGKEGE